MVYQLFPNPRHQVFIQENATMSGDIQRIPTWFPIFPGLVTGCVFPEHNSVSSHFSLENLRIWKSTPHLQGVFALVEDYLFLEKVSVKTIMTKISELDVRNYCL